MSSVNGNGVAHADGVPALAPPSDRQPPQNLEAEQGVIGSILLDNNLIPQVAELLAPEDFYRDAHIILFRIVLFLHGLAKPVDTITIIEELNSRALLQRVDPRTKLAECDEILEKALGSVPHTANCLYYAEIVRQKSLARKVAERAELMLRDVYSNNFTAEELLRSAEAGIAEVAAEGVEDEDNHLNLRPWPDSPDPAVWHGLAGRIVSMIAPHTEADPMAILGQFLVAFGNLIGRRAHWRVDASRHACNEFLCVVGNSAKARKGTSWDIVLWLLKACDDAWFKKRVLSGLSSGEGMIWAVRDPIMAQQKQGEKQRALWNEVEIDPGITDKRALFVETEFGSTLGILNREGNALSGYIRKAFDSGDLATQVKMNPARATGAHISIIGHVTNEELHMRLTRNEAANGFANRFLWVCARRARLLPRGGQFHEINWTESFRELAHVISFAREEWADAAKDSFQIVRDEEANKLWDEAYPVLTEARPGLFGSVVSRAEAHVMRLATIYTLLDGESITRYAHLKAALAFWKYCEQSAAYIFGDSLSVPHADKVLEFIRVAADEGVTQGAILRKVFGGKQPKAPQGGLNEILACLVRAGLVVSQEVKTKGRPATLWKKT